MKHKIIHVVSFGIIYYLIECVWRFELANVRMAILGGVLGLLIGMVNDLFSFDTDFRLQCLVGMLLTLLSECVLGYHWNIELGLNIWNYSSIPLSAVHGQINALYAIAWFILSGVCIVLDDAIDYYICNEGDRPYYKINGKCIYMFPIK